MCPRNLLLHFSFVMFFDRDKKGGNVKADRQAEKSNLMIHGMSLLLLQLLKLSRFKREKMITILQLDVTHGMNSDFWNANENMFITQSN
jgi:hypothetical protein